MELSKNEASIFWYLVGREILRQSSELPLCARSHSCLPPEKKSLGNEDTRSRRAYVTALIWQRQRVRTETGTKHCRHAAASLPCASALSFSWTDWGEMKNRRRQAGAGCSRTPTQLPLCGRPRCLPPSSAAGRGGLPSPRSRVGNGAAPSDITLICTACLQAAAPSLSST